MGSGLAQCCSASFAWHTAVLSYICCGFLADGSWARHGEAHFSASNATRQRFAIVALPAVQVPWISSGAGPAFWFPPFGNTLLQNNIALLGPTTATAFGTKTTSGSPQICNQWISGLVQPQWHFAGLITSVHCGSTHCRRIQTAQTYAAGRVTLTTGFCDPIATVETIKLSSGTSTCRGWPDASAC